MTELAKKYIKTEIRALLQVFFKDAKITKEIKHKKLNGTPNDEKYIIWNENFTG